MLIKNTTKKLRPELSVNSGVFIFKGSITVAGDFPTVAEVKEGYSYKIEADVTDNDPTKTNTSQSFRAEDFIAWNGTDWTDITGIEVWTDDGTNVKTINSRDVDLQDKGLKDINVSTAVKLGSATDTSLNTTKKDILGGINENKSNIDLKANDNAVVHLAGTETITGVKTFNSSIEGLAGVNIPISQAYKINNVDINTAGTLGNVPYLNKANVFAEKQTIYSKIQNKVDDYTLVISDASTVIEIDNAISKKIIIPLNDDVAFPIGTTISIIQVGDGQVEVEGLAGVDILNSKSNFLRAKNSVACLLKKGVNTWYLFGDLEV